MAAQRVHAAVGGAKDDLEAAVAVDVAGGGALVVVLLSLGARVLLKALESCIGRWRAEMRADKRSEQRIIRKSKVLSSSPHHRSKRAPARPCS